MDFLVGAVAISSNRFLLPSISVPPRKAKTLPILASASSKAPNPLLRSLRTTLSSAVLLTAVSAALLSGKARADPSVPPPSTVQTIAPSSETADSTGESSSSTESTLSQMLESNEQISDAIRQIIYTKLESAADDQETLSLLRKVISSRPSEVEWKLLAVKLLSDNREYREARKILEEVLSKEPLSLEALHEFAVVMHMAKEDSVVYEKLEEAMEIAKGENKEREVREIRFIKAQMLILQRKLEDALKSFEELRDEDPEDYRPYFAQGVVYSLMDKDNEAKEVFRKLKEISGGNFEVETFLQNGMSSIMLFGTGGEARDI
ncbi:Tetratricopeptide repeat (TPR)-like superfamily protein [Rhynchospora pubera]|uniref:Tetratricopeptide repeat (TPR)-like superfamily protein n=1 Tax=Rhynchospora pubera TaxID=906938 RepID=A0AAV8H4Q0_9POAL|nr:Tetratricopeptide repeat (TPR)-like superfamily protein [Rhynchospora pubera]